ncbi:MAG: hypothetical protein Q9168_004058 [Polycauliona sp. 1 TL-2023]
MADLKSLLSSFGLLQYHHHLVEAGFDTWETILDITESDLESLSVQLGHRRRLQHEIAHTLSSRQNTQSQQPNAPPRLLPYIRHPKSDPNAPQRPQSAYELFSSHVRIDLKEQSLSFTEQSKIAEKRWKDMSDSAKDSWTQATNEAWDKYEVDKIKYQGSSPYREYQEYLLKFNGFQPSKKRKIPSNGLDHEVNESPRPEEAKNISHGQPSRTTPDESNEETSDDPGGEDDTSNVGSMGSTDHLNEEAFAAEPGNERIHSFLGQTASDTWVERIKHNLKISDADEPTHGHDPAGGYSPRRHKEQIPSTTTDPNPTSPLRASLFHEHLEPYELPTKASADSLVAAYFAAVHPVFPIVSRDQFLRDYERFFASTESDRWSTWMFVPMLHIVLAIGAIHAYVIHASWVGDQRSRLLRFASAKANILDAWIFKASAYEQVQLCGLGGLYMLIMYDINKAWNLAGLGIRCAQALGLHLVNRTPDMTESQMNLRLGMWTSVLSLERTVAIVTGRPSMVRDRDCTANLASHGLIDPVKHLDQDSTPPASARADSSSILQYAELSSLADLVLAALYSAHIRHIKWSELQATIRELDQKACDWNTNLSRSFETDPTCQTPEQDSARIAIGMFFHSTRVLINRPCLCRLDRRIEHQSESSGSINAAAAHRCVTSARSILGLIPNEPSPNIIFRGPFWWMGFHHLKRATTVLIQEITFQSESTSAAGADIVTDAIKAINWLHALGLSSNPAYSAWITLSRLLLRAAQEFGGDVSGARIADAGEDPSLESGDVMAKGASQEEVPNSGSEMQHEGFSTESGEQTTGENMFSDLNMMNAWDQLFGLGQESFSPLNNELDDFYDGDEGSKDRY